MFKSYWGQPKIGLYLLMSAFTISLSVNLHAGKNQTVFLDPLVTEVLEKDGQVDVLVIFKGQDLPDDLSGSMSEKARQIEKIRAKQFESAFRALRNYLGADQSEFKISTQQPTSLTVRGILLTPEVFEKLKRFPGIASIHYSLREQTLQILPGDDPVD